MYCAIKYLSFGQKLFIHKFTLLDNFISHRVNTNITQMNTNEHNLKRCISAF